jgi:hypothetical protein
MLESQYWINTVFPPFKAKYPVDAGKIEAEQAKPGSRPLPSSGFARGVVEELRKHPLASNPLTDFGLWNKPVVMLHNARGGVEYWDLQKQYFGSVSLDLNSDSPWDFYISTANTKALPWTYWKHCHTYSEIQEFLDLVKTHQLKTGGLNLESIYSEDLRPPRIADMIDSTLGTSAILCIPTLGWIDGIDWSALSRHVFLLEFFINDPVPDWVGRDDIELARELIQHAQDWGARKIALLCGAYDGRLSNNPNGRLVSPERYKQIINTVGARYGGVYLGDHIGTNYAEWSF